MMSRSVRGGGGRGCRTPLLPGRASILPVATLRMSPEEADEGLRPLDPRQAPRSGRGAVHAAGAPWRGVSAARAGTRAAAELVLPVGEFGRCRRARATYGVAVRGHLTAPKGGEHASRALRGCDDSRGDRRGAGPPLASPATIPGVCWLVSHNHADCRFDLHDRVAGKAPGRSAHADVDRLVGPRWERRSGWRAWAAMRRTTSLYLPDRRVTDATPATPCSPGAPTLAGPRRAARGEDGLTDSGQGGEDRHVALPAGLAGAGVLAAGQDVDQAGDLPLGVGELALYEAEAFGSAPDVGHRGLGGTGCDGNGRGAEDLDELVGRDPPDPVALEQALEGPELNPPGLRGRRSLGPEVEEPGLDHASDRFEDLRVVAPQLLSHAVRQANAVPGELLGDPRPCPEFDDGRVDRVDPPEW